MNFDLEDPLGSDDSFFEEPKVISKRPSVTKTADRKSIENLFNITDSSTKENVESNTIVPDNITRPKNVVTFEEPIIKQELNSKVTDTDIFNKVQKKNEDWLSEPDNIKIPDKKVKKTDFLEDILSVRQSSKDKKITSFEDILKESKISTGAKSSVQIKETPTPTETKSNFSLLSNTSRERRRTRRGSSTAVEDTLGLFGDEYQSGDFYSKDINESISKPTGTDFYTKTASASEKGIPDWLGGSVLGSTKANTEFSKQSERDIKGVVESEETNIVAEEQDDKSKSTLGVVEKSTVDNLSTDLKHQHINTELQNTYASLQQQETFLLISIQLKKYEENLEAIRRQQQEILGKQEKQFHSLLDKYVIKQQSIENNIRLQQERINNHLQMLISHPLNNSESNNPEDENTKHVNENSKYTEDMVQSLKQRHNEELFIMEESYKKQISLLEQSASAIEERLKNEIINITKASEDKIDNIIKNYNEEITYYKQKMDSINEQHNNEIELIKTNHARVIEEIKAEYSAQVEYIKEFNKRQTELLNDGNIYSQKLDANIEILDSNTKALEVVQDKVINSYDIISVARENSFERKEKEIILMRNALEKCREAAENERSQLLALIRNLETKIAEQNNNAREDRWALQQASATLVARSAALDREAEYSKNIIEREREQLKTLKESLLAEQEKIILQLTEEKLLLASEKSRFETSSKLSNNYESERIKVEAETAIQVAKDLTLKINEERDHLARQKNEVEMLKRKLANREKELEDKQSEFEFLTQNTQKKINEEKKIVSEAKKLEYKYKERLQELQSQWISLSDREKKLAEEKVLLSKERLALYTTMKQTKTCVLCNANNPSIHHDSYQTINNQDHLMNNKISEADTIRIRLDAIEDEGSSEVSKEEHNFMPYNEGI